MVAFNFSFPKAQLPQAAAGELSQVQRELLGLSFLDTFASFPASMDASRLPELSLLATVLKQRAEHLPNTLLSTALWLNINAPFSALLCGVQGAGKSHSTAVMLEAALMQRKELGTLPEPLSAIVFHFDSAIGVGTARPCEAAYVSKMSTGDPSFVPVTVLVSPTCLQTMTTVYKDLPVTIKPFQILTTDLTANRLLSLMQLDETGRMPLYMSAVLAILRRMGSDHFSYTMFRREIANLKLSDQQREMLNLRLDLLDSFVVPPSRTAVSLRSRCGKGKLVIVDLSDPFLDAATACSLFRVGMGLFVEKGEDEAGKMILFDEAHKYLTTDPAASALTSDLLSLIRQQRHLGCRFIISTQEPTIVPTAIIDLCSIILAYRFSSPLWASHLSRHVSSGNEVRESDWFNKAVELQTGQAILFCPSGYSKNKDGQVARIGRGHLLVKMRKRITSDGGKSMLATLGIETEPKAVGMERNISDIKLSFKAFGDLALTDSDKTQRQPIVEAPDVPSVVVTPASILERTVKALPQQRSQQRQA